MATVPQPIPCEVPECMPHFEGKGIHNITLKPHQVMSILRADKLERFEDINIPGTTTSFKSHVGVLCDKVGAGKTLTALGLIGYKPLVPNPEVFTFKSCLNDNWNINSIHSVIGETSNKINCVSTTLPLSIIVVPHTIFSQWENTIKNHTTIPFYGIRNKKTNDKFWEETSVEELKAGKYNIVLCTNKFFRIFAEHGFGKDITVSRVIYDEVDTLNIPRNGKILSNFYWGMTATYDTIINGYYSSNTRFPNAGFIRELFCRFRNFWSSNGFLIRLTNTDRVNVVSELFICNSKEFIESSFHLPEIKIIIHRCDAPPMVAVLDGVVSSDVMTLLNAGDVGAAINAVSCVKVDTQVSLIDVVTSEFKKELHNANIAFKAAAEYQYSSDAAREKSLERHQDEIDVLEGKIGNLRSRIEKSDMCPICCDEMENTTITRCCNNSFCFECITKSLTAIHSCPCCRANITQEDLIIITDAGGGAKENKGEKKRKEKGDAFSEIVNSNKEWTSRTGVSCKYLVYSESYNTFHDVRATLRENEISNGVVKGSIGAVKNLIEKYRENNNELQALLINGKYAASGMNLENTTDVVVWHSMSKSMITQIIGRAQRPGRTEPLRVHFLSYPNELKDFEEYNN